MYLILVPKYRGCLLGIATMSHENINNKIKYIYLFIYIFMFFTEPKFNNIPEIRKLIALVQGYELKYRPESPLT